MLLLLLGECVYYESIYKAGCILSVLLSNLLLLRFYKSKLSKNKGDCSRVSFI